MDEKTIEATARPVVIIRPGRRNGKAIMQAFTEALNEMLVYPPATAEEAMIFCRIRIKRCNINLASAKDRGDKRAVINLERKLAVYEYLYKLAKAQAEAFEGATDCPNCRVHAVEKDGECSCCGQKVEVVL